MERKEILLIVLISVVLLSTAVQSVQLVRLNDNPVVVTSGSRVAPSAGSGSNDKQPVASATASLDNLPSMVGGC